MKKLPIFALLLLAAVIACGRASSDKAAAAEEIEVAVLTDTPAITPPPAELGLDTSFYKKYMNVNGIHVASSWRVPDSCYYAAYVILDNMTKALKPEVLKVLTDNDTRITIMARYEGTTDVPEHHFLVNDTSLNWDLRARGLGAGQEGELTSCAEENILAYQIDKYHAEDITIHEFAHTLHLTGICKIDTGFNTELKEAMAEAMAKGRYRNTYAATNHEEYFAEGVQNWFNVNAEIESNDGDGKHNRVNTREEMKEYDPKLYAIIARYFPEVNTQISRHKKEDKYHWTEAEDQPKN